MDSTNGQQDQKIQVLPSQSRTIESATTINGNGGNTTTTTTTNNVTTTTLGGQQLRAINLVTAAHPQQQTRQIILSKSQASIINRSLQTNNGGGQSSQIIVLAPSNRALNEQGIQFLIQQKPGGNSNGTSSVTSMINGSSVTSSPSTPAKIFVQAPGSSINMLKNIQMNKPPAVKIEPIKPTLTTNTTTTSTPSVPITPVTPNSQINTPPKNSPQIKQEFQSSSNSHIIGLLNSNRNIQPATTSSEPTPPKSKRSEKNTKDSSSSSSSNQTVASLINSRLQQQIQLQQQKQQQSNQQSTQATNSIPKQQPQTPSTPTSTPIITTPQETRDTIPLVNQIQTNASIDSILNQFVLPDTRIFSTLLNKDADTPGPNESKARESLKCKKVFIGNREHVILDNFSNLSDFKGDFNGLRSMACSIADKLNLPVSIPAFLMIEDETCIDKIKGVLREQSINPIIIEMKSSLPVSEQVPKPDEAVSNERVGEPKYIRKVIRRKKPDTDSTDSESKLLKKRRDSFKAEPNSKPSTPRPKKKCKTDDLSTSEIGPTADSPKIEPEIINPNNNIDQQFQLINQFIDTLNSNENVTVVDHNHQHNQVLGICGGDVGFGDQLESSLAKNTGVRKNSLNDCELNFDSFDVNMLLNDIEFQKDFF